MWEAPRARCSDQVIAGAYCWALQIFNHTQVISAKQRRAGDWINGAVPDASVLSVTTRDAQPPNSGKVMADCIIPRRASGIFRAAIICRRTRGVAGA